MNRRLFYNDEASGGGGGEMVSVAQSLATTGVRIEAGEFTEQPIENTQPTETKTEEKQEGAKPDADKVEITPVAETQKEPTPTEAKVTTVISEQPAPQKDWREVLKQEQPDTVLKELGFDGEKLEFAKNLKSLNPKIVNFLNKWQNGEDISGHLKVMSTDYGKMPAEEVMRHQLRKEYPKASDKAFEVVYQEEVVNKYKLNEDYFTEAEVERGKLLLEAKADKFRDELIKEQEDYLFQKAPEKTNLPDIAERQQYEQHLQVIDSEIRNSSLIKDISTNNLFSFGEGEEKFTFPIQANEIVDLMINGDNGNLTFDIQKDSNGNEKYIPKTENQLYTAMAMKYGKSLFDALAIHYKTIGAKTIASNLENAKPPETTRNFQQGEAETKTVAGSMATAGRRVESDN